MINKYSPQKKKKKDKVKKNNNKKAIKKLQTGHLKRTKWQNEVTDSKFNES